MSTAISQASVGRPLPLRMRADLRIERQTFDGRESWVVKDPIKLRYYRFDDEEYSVLSMLDGTTSMETIKRKFERQFAPQRLTYAEIHRLLAMLHRSALVLSDAPGQSLPLLKRRAEEEFKRHEAAISNPLSIRFRGIDPQRLLMRLDVWFGWLFTVPGAFLVGLLVFSAVGLLTAEFDVFWNRLPGFTQFFAPKNWLFLAVALGFTKVLHELGHGISCRRFGGECHEMGLMLLCFTPCLYCNVTDTYMNPSKWKRAAVGAAGMYIELLLAAIATIIWWNTKPGMLNGLCLNVMFTCSVSTLLFNANPLMRYDGYYILADLVEIPNLRQRAQDELSRNLSWWCLGIEPSNPSYERRPWLLMLFAVASSLYGWFVSFSILWFLYKATEPVGAKVLGQMLAAVSVYQLIARPARAVWQFLKSHRRMQRMNPFRAGVSATVVVAAAAAILAIPLPYRVTCELTAKPRNLHAVYVVLAGQLKEILVRPGERVAQGDPIVQLVNPEIEMRIGLLDSQIVRFETARDELKRRAVTEDAVRREIAEMEKTLESVRAQRDRRVAEREQLVLRASQPGIVIAAPRRPTAADDSELPTWAGHPLELRNLGAKLTESDLVCYIGDPAEGEATLAVDVRDLDSVKAGYRVDVYLDQYPARRFTGKIESVAPSRMKDTPAALSSKTGGDLATETLASGKERSVETVYQANVPFTEPKGGLALNAHGRARVHAGTMTIGGRLWRAFSHTFHFEL
jgi:putative peptide zinc metalloprotease protein